MYASISSLPPTAPTSSLSVIKQHHAEPCVLCSSLSLVVRVTHGGTCMSVPLSQFTPPSPSSHSIHKSILYIKSFFQPFKHVFILMESSLSFFFFQCVFRYVISKRPLSNSKSQNFQEFYSFSSCI